MELKPFKVSVSLKDLIGRDLITDEFVAVFELVKNAFDAHAKKVHLYFGSDIIIIADDGKGMSRADILNKWLFVAYSAKREGTEDENYRDRIGEKNRPFAGAKGVGRFSCDRLGEQLTISSRAEGQPVQILEVDWRSYEGDAKQEFGEVLVKLSDTLDFPKSELKQLSQTGTNLEIRGLRSKWNRGKLQELKRELTKLIDPFSSSSQIFQVEIIAPAEEAEDELDIEYNRHIRENQQPRLIVNGKIENSILDVLAKRTTSIKIRLTESGSIIESVLEDRGEVIYRIRESNPYLGLNETELQAEIYFLNRSAKTVFAYRMGLPVVNFGSIFLFRNGFRVSPIGNEDDDFFGLNHRKQQGQKRYLGGRDLIGHIEIKGVAGFDETTSRNQGLIRTQQVKQLIDCIKDKCVRRLERYVVDITWRDKFDAEVDDTSRVRLDENSALITKLVSRLSATEGVELIEYNPELVRIIDEKSTAFEDSLKALELLADQTKDRALLSRVHDAKLRIEALRAAEAEANEAKNRAESRAIAAETAAAVAEVKFIEERERNTFLAAASSLDHDTVMNLHHQIIMHASDVHHGVKRMMGRMRNASQISKDEWIDFLEIVSYRNSQILTAAKFATKAGYKKQSTEVKMDLAGYIQDYVETVSSLWAPRGVIVHVSNNAKPLERKFRPIEVSMVIDNLVSNAVKARAAQIEFEMTNSKGAKPELLISVADDGTGWPSTMNPIDRVFDKGLTTTDGSGLGLFHVKQVVEALGGMVEAHLSPFSEQLDGAHVTLRVPI